jgi:non-homologous end joining protein Ku
LRYPYEVRSEEKYFDEIEQGRTRTQSNLAHLQLDRAGWLK